MRTAAGIIMIIAGVIEIGIMSTYAIHEALWAVLIIWPGFVLAGGIFALQRKHWGLCLAASILSTGILPIIFICVRKREFE